MIKLKTVILIILALVMGVILIALLVDGTNIIRFFANLPGLKVYQNISSEQTDFINDYIGDEKGRMRNISKIIVSAQWDGTEIYILGKADKADSQLTSENRDIVLPNLERFNYDIMFHVNSSYDDHSAWCYKNSKTEEMMIYFFKPSAYFRDTLTELFE